MKKTPQRGAVLDKTKHNLTAKISAHEDELNMIEREVLTLKASLYAKFGKEPIFAAFRVSFLTIFFRIPVPKVFSRFAQFLFI